MAKIGLTQMVAIEHFFDELDSVRIARARELTELKSFARSELVDARKGLLTKSVIVLSYAHWEGFYNECVAQYVKLLTARGDLVKDIEWRLLVGVIRGSLDGLRDSNFSDKSKVIFIDNLKDELEADFTQFHRLEVEAKSNLNFEKLRKNFELLNFNIDVFQPSRLRIDKELVGWRHSIAHGDDPDLSEMDATNHIEFALKQMMELADIFQWKMLELYSEQD